MKKLLIIIVLLSSLTMFSQTTTWDGFSWNNGTPNSTTNAIIAGPYDTVNDGSIDCNNLTVNNNFSLVISSGEYFNVYGNITVQPLGQLLVQPGGSLIPNNNNCIAIGDVKVERRTPSMKLYDYTYWSSPVTTTLGAALLSTKWEDIMTFYFNTPTFYDVETSYWGTFISNLPDGQDDNQDAWVHTSPTDNMIPGKGYASMVKSIPPVGTYPRAETVTFVGPLNTGVITIPVDLSQNTVSDIDDFNLIGNPYSAAINSNDFIDTNLPNISGTLYFWTHSNTMSTAFTGLAMYNFSPNDYAKYTKLGGIRAVFGGHIPSNVIGSGQGFLVEAENATDLTFMPNMMSNAYSNATSVSFFRNGNNSTRKLWLNLFNDDFFSQQLIGYGNQTDLNYNKGWDSRIINVKVPLKFYSIQNDIMYDIQARNKFSKNDIVTLGYYAALDGEYTINLDNKEGNFEKIYLYDKNLNICHNLKTPYTFITVAGSFDTRFELRYKKVEDDDDDRKLFIDGKVCNVKVYDLSGRMIKDVNSNDIDLIINELPKGLMVLKITIDGETITKKIIL
jgi:hypothetical protein